MVTIYTAPGCGPCKELKEAVESGNIEVRGASAEGSEITLVDVTTDEGYPAIDEKGIDQIPAAYSEGQKCYLLVDDATGKVVVDCGGPSPSAEGEGDGITELETEEVPS